MASVTYERLMGIPSLYRLWQAPFAARKFAPVERQLKTCPPRRVLDAGCGPGTSASRFADAEYVGVDINPRYLAVARRRFPGRFIEADLALADLSSLGTFDTILVNSFLHHLPDDSVQALLAQLHGRLEPGGRIHVLELVLPPQASVARLMARIDRGRFPRSLTHWRTLFESRFTPVVVEPYMLGGCLWSMVYFQGAKG